MRELFGRLRSDLGRVAVDRLPPAKHHVVAANGSHRLRQDVTGGQGVACRRTAIGDEDRAIHPSIKAVTQDVSSLGWAHANHGDHSAEAIAQLQRALQGAKVFRLKIVGSAAD